MNLLIASATIDEINILQSHVNRNHPKTHEIDFLITGVGQMHACFSLTDKLKDTSYDLVIQAGICGSVSKQNQLGELVQIIEDEIIDLGSTSNNKYLPLSLAKFTSQNGVSQNLRFTPDKTIISKSLEAIKKGKGITSNTVHGDQFWMQYLQINHPNSFESMEGAVSFFVGNHFSTPVLQIRSISNYIEQRSMDNWDVKKAICNLNQFLIQLIDEL